MGQYGYQNVHISNTIMNLHYTLMSLQYMHRITITELEYDSFYIPIRELLWMRPVGEKTSPSKNVYTVNYVY